MFTRGGGGFPAEIDGKESSICSVYFMGLTSQGSSLLGNLNPNEHSTVVGLLFIGFIDKQSRCRPRESGQIRESVLAVLKQNI